MNQKSKQALLPSSLLTCCKAAHFRVYCSPGSGVCFRPLSLLRQLSLTHLHVAHSIAPTSHPQFQSPHLIPARHPLIESPRCYVTRKENLSAHSHLQSGPSRVSVLLQRTNTTTGVQPEVGVSCGMSQVGTARASLVLHSISGARLLCSDLLIILQSESTSLNYYDFGVFFKILSLKLV